MRILRRILTWLFVFVVLFAFCRGCENSQERYRAGRQDGYAVGYNTACEIRATLAGNDWSSENYSRGYADGIEEGIIDCNSERKRKASENDDW